MSSVRAVVLGAVSALYGAMWLFAATTKVLAPLPAYEFAGRVIPPGPVAKTLIVVVIAAEGALGTAMLIRAISACRAFLASAVALSMAIGALLVVRSRSDGLVQCGCYGDRFRMTIDQELGVDAVLVALALGLAAWHRLGRRAATPAPDA